MEIARAKAAGRIDSSARNSVPMIRMQSVIGQNFRLRWLFGNGPEANPNTSAWWSLNKTRMDAARWSWHCSHGGVINSVISFLIIYNEKLFISKNVITSLITRCWWVRSVVKGCRRIADGRLADARRHRNDFDVDIDIFFLLIRYRMIRVDIWRRNRAFWRQVQRFILHGWWISERRFSRCGRSRRCRWHHVGYDDWSPARHSIRKTTQYHSQLLFCYFY